MTLKLIREFVYPDQVSGSLFIDGRYFCDTMEPNYPDGPKVPLGEYVCVRGNHKLNSGPIETFEITEVPGHTGILFHPGNTVLDSSGCLLLGVLATPKRLISSRGIFNLFMQELNGLDKVNLIVQNM